MVYILAAVIVILIGIICYQTYSRLSYRKQMQHLRREIERISQVASNEKLLLFTGDRELQSLLMEINRLLASQHQVYSDYTKMEISMKKMVSNISHDLKTPLTVVLGYIEILYHDPNIPAEERQRILGKVYEKTKETLALIHDFFDLAKLESGDTEFPMSRILMNERCSSTILEYYDILTEKGFQVHIDIPDHPIYGFGNNEALHRVLNNLISNSIQYGSLGKQLGLTLREDQSLVYVDIWDRGKGIDAMHIDHVFERMYTLEDSRNKSYQGSGLGLTITKRLVESMGGSIHLRSKPGELTVFTVKLKKVQY
ncbi:HAMP domain-containing histidine kinase [Paenibacillus sp. N1-5-1-14]|uniref:HAMP domain-containing histidine kinase n=1 Tax=Paenibacillus radicibacter TaxID=2972488 RepID=UPI002159A8EA|nr:HAMP domain-containing histidine kinase [Paenibacillus radicibacter]MCR8643351.1 HAMP domain-containing histidine kinase [Paenibacillus radicibacter]